MPILRGFRNTVAYSKDSAPHGRRTDQNRARQQGFRSLTVPAPIRAARVSKRSLDTLTNF
jgi:hypothetical protein